MKYFLQIILFCLSTVVVAQTQVSGTVTDANGQPVPGASVIVDSNTGTVTDFDGNFSLSTSKTPPFTITDFLSSNSRFKCQYLELYI